MSPLQDPEDPEVLDLKSNHDILTCGMFYRNVAAGREFALFRDSPDVERCFCISEVQWTFRCSSPALDRI